MKKHNKKLLSLFLAAALTASFSMPVSAEEIMPLSNNSVIADPVTADTVIVNPVTGEKTGITPDQALSIQSSGTSSVAAELESVAAELESLTPGTDYVDKEGVFIADTKEEAERIAAQYNGTLKSYNHRIAVVQLKESTADALKAAALNNSTDTLIEPNYIYYSMDVEKDISVSSGNIFTGGHLDSTLTNDPYADSTDTHYQYFHEKINTLKAHEMTTGEGAKIAVLDSGCTPDHEDSSFDEKHALHVSAMSTGTDTTVGHGIHCTGIIHEKKDNSLGGFGVAPDAEIYSIKMSNSKSFTMNSILEGVSMAIELKVNVISMSLGGPTFSDAFQQLINEAYDKGIMVVAAAGNESTSSSHYPGAYDHVLCVAATDKDDNLADYSNYGDWVDIAAPGSAITSTYLYGISGSFAGTTNQDTYGSIDGTSMATPVVAGVAALCYSMNPDLCFMENREAVDMVTDAILNNTDGKEYSYLSRSVKGLVQADKAVEEIQSSISKTYTLVDEAGNYGAFLRGNIAQGKKVKLQIGDLQGNTKNKALKKAIKDAKWTSSSPSVTVKKGVVKCDKRAVTDSEVTITAEIGGDTLRCKYTVTKPLVGAGDGKYKAVKKKGGYKIRFISTLKVKTALKCGTELDLLSPSDSLTALLFYEKKFTSLYNPVWILADNSYKYDVTFKDKDIKKGYITLVTNKKGRPLKAVFNNPGKYSVKFKPIDGSNKTFTYKFEVK